MRVIEKTVYRVDELSSRAKDRARDWWRECEAQENTWSEFTIEDAERMGELLGIDFKTHSVLLMSGKTRQKPNIWWSGFSSQGDGACFEGTYTYKADAVQKIAEEAPPDENDPKNSNNRLNQIAQELHGLQLSLYPKSPEAAAVVDGLADEESHDYTISASVQHRGSYHHEHSTNIEVYLGDSGNELYADDATAKRVAELLRDFMRWIYRNLEAEYEYQNSNEAVDEMLRANDYEFDEDGRIAA